tara:strand:+ start:720 stop:1202 length:483 start_codon:yes stop_codon:yes gene_type:complete
MQIIKDKAIVDDNWQYITDEEALPASGDIIISATRWAAEQENLAAYNGAVGVQLEPGDDAMVLKGTIESLPLIAINFPVFSDGRGFTQAKILRDRLGYKGELRARGDVARDQMFYMMRVGFNAYEVKAGRSLQDALQAFDDFTVKYQVSADEKQPLYRRR